MKYVCLFALICMSGIVCYAADSEDGNSLLRNCRAAVRALDGEKLDLNESTKAGLCMGYIAGVADLDATWRSEDKEDKSKNFPLHICLPEGGEVRLGQCARIVAKWLKDNLEKLHYRGDLVVLLALGQAFPCK